MLWSRSCWCYWCWVNSWCDGSWSPTLILGALPWSPSPPTLRPCTVASLLGPCLLFTSSTVPMGCVMISIKWRSAQTRSSGHHDDTISCTTAPHTTPHTIQSNVPLKMYFSTVRRNESVGSVPLGWSILPHNEFGHNQVPVFGPGPGALFGLRGIYQKLLCLGKWRRWLICQYIFT